MFKFIDSLHIKVKAGVVGGAVATLALTILNAVDVTEASPLVAGLVTMAVAFGNAYRKS